MFNPGYFFQDLKTLESLSNSWPSKMVKGAWNAATLPGDVWHGEVDPMSNEAIERSADLAGLAMTGTLGAPKNALGAGPILPKRGPMAVEPPTPMAIQPPQGIRAYHGSPHDFDKFDITKIGTGEGAQSYGHGLYFAENEGVAKSYRDALAKRNAPQSLTDDMGKLVVGDTPLRKRFDVDNMPEFSQLAATGDMTGMSKLAQDRLARWRQYVGDPNYQFQDYAVGKVKAYEGLVDALSRGEVVSHMQPPQGRMYEVNINARPDQFLDWDKPLSQQPKTFQDWAGSQRSPITSNTSRNGRIVEPNGEDVYRRLGYGPDPANMLREAGIPGIRYLDQGSRDKGQGSFNYVLFNDHLVDILKKYGIAGAAAAPVIAAAANSQEPVANY